MLNWFDVKVKYEKTEEGKIVVVREEYLFDALSFTEAETRVNEELKPFISGDFITTNISRARINELFADENGDKWYACKVFFISLDEEKGIEKRSAAKMMVQANDVKEAWDGIKKGMTGSMADYQIAAIVETQILDVYPYVSPDKDETNKLDIKVSIVENDTIPKESELPYDPLLRSAALAIIEDGNASTSLIQRKLSLGYNRAGRIMEQLEILGVVGCFKGVKARSVLVTIEQFESMPII